MKHGWKAGSRIKLDANEVGQELARLQAQNQGLTPQAVVEAAKNPASPLHGGFEWDDSVAAEQYRLDQARYLLRMLVIVEGRPSNPIRAYVSIRQADGPTYEDIATVLLDENLRKQALVQAYRDLEAFRRKYKDLSELADVLQAADRTLASGE